MISDYFDETAATEIINNDVSFYEINPCKVSTFEFLNKNNFNNDITYCFDYVSNNSIMLDMPTLENTKM